MVLVHLEFKHYSPSISLKRRGISRISADGVELNIMRESGISKNYGVACTNFCLLLNIMRVIVSDLDLITLYIYYFYLLCTLLIT